MVPPRQPEIRPEKTMPPLKNTRHEAYAQARARGASIDASYVLAGYSENRGNAARLNANESVMKRVEELQWSQAERSVWTAAERIEQLQRIALAMETDEPRTTIAAIAEANKMQGSHAPSKSEVSGPDGEPVPNAIQVNFTAPD